MARAHLSSMLSPVFVSRLLVLVWVCATTGCFARNHTPTSDLLSFSFEGLDASAERRVSLGDVVFEPSDNVQSAKLDARGRMLVQRVDSARTLTVRCAGMCPVTAAAGPQPAPLALKPVLELGGDRTGIGFDTRFSVRAAHNCPELGAGQVSWRQLDGPPLRELTVSEDGTQLSARMPSFAAIHPEPAPAGIIPISPRTQARVVLEATWRAQTHVATRSVTISAAARSTGLSSVAVSQPVLIAGSGWQIERRPPGGRATLQASQDMTFFTADMPGGWTLRRAEPGQEPVTLKLNSLTHDATPYDCARSECHAELSALAATTPMSHALEHHLSEQVDSAAVGCMLDCHVLGERGLSDGGFHAVAQRLGFTWTEHTRWDDLPQALRRLGAVRCTGCHGPGAIPPPEQRSAILRSDVCASCHDAPPRYVHVSEWRSGRMASADRDPETRALPCARCHTSSGFLAHNLARKPDGAARTEPSGIACAACHAPHASDRGPRLVRLVAPTAAAPAADPFGEPRTALCRSCHAPSGDPSGAAAPSGTLWSETLQVPAADGGGWDDVRSRAVHAAVPKGCVGCHGGGALGEGHLNHSFRAEPRVCAGCHVEPMPQAGSQAAADLQRRAHELADKLARFCSPQRQPALAHRQLEQPRCDSKPLERAHYEVSLVLEDDAALFHNADLARALLVDAENQLRNHSSL